MPARVAEVAPDEGNIFAFVRSDHSWHGHTPFVGERQVVQVTWLRDASEWSGRSAAAGWPGC
jgi:SM-20-related protein